MIFQVAAPRFSGRRSASARRKCAAQKRCALALGFKSGVCAATENSRFHRVPQNVCSGPTALYKITARHAQHLFRRANHTAARQLFGAPIEATLCVAVGFSPASFLPPKPQSRTRTRKSALRHPNRSPRMRSKKRQRQRPSLRRRGRRISRPRITKETMIRVRKIHVHKRLPRRPHSIRHRSRMFRRNVLVQPAPTKQHRPMQLFRARNQPGPAGPRRDPAAIK